MSVSSEVYKEEALRLLCTAEQMVRGVECYVRNLRGKNLPGARVEQISERHHDTLDHLVIIVEGNAVAIDDRVWAWKDRGREARLVKLRNRWLVRKLRQYAVTLRAFCKVSTSTGTVYFHYRVEVPKQSHLLE